jgi:ribosomal protein RSM22 (predicted rRNA methylase)
MTLSLSELDKNEPNVTKEWDRVIFPIIRRGKHTLFNLCTKSGTFERRVTSKSHGIEYSEGKKLRWGDYWRFGKRIPNKYRK